MLTGENGSAAKRADVSRHRDGFDGIGIAGRANDEGACLCAFAQHVITAHHDMLLNEDLVAPFIDAGMNLQRFAVSGGGA